MDSLSIDLKPELKHSTNDLKKVRDSSLAPWTDLLDDPKQWTDYRDSKRDGQVNPRFPDFKRKDGNGALWLNNAPKWVLSRLQELKFDVPAVKSKQAKDFKVEREARAATTERRQRTQKEGEGELVTMFITATLTCNPSGGLRVVERGSASAWLGSWGGTILACPLQVESWVMELWGLKSQVS
ncbi:Protein OSB4 [Arachis hypogaea]|nr:Protein OSB4 [Arachis hypogaea]